MKLIKRVKNKLKRILGLRLSPPSNDEIISGFLAGNRIPWSSGYHQYKWDFINKAIVNKDILEVFAKRKPLPKNFGLKLDDRCVEYPWIFANLKQYETELLDAGSTFNFSSIVSHPIVEKKALTILTFYPELVNFNEKRISYVYGDLRKMPLCTNWFDEIVCQSTLEHIGMDNSIYGYENSSQSLGKSKDYSYMDAIAELIRVLKPTGQLLLTFPFGKYEFHGFFQQFDVEMLQRMKVLFEKNGKVSIDFFKYKQDGWYWSDIDEASKSESFNPHTGIGKGTDDAAHSRAICCVKFVKLE